MRRYMIGCLASVGLLSLLFAGAVGGLIWWGLSWIGGDAKAELPQHLLLSLAAPAKFSERQESGDFTALFAEASPSLQRMVEILDYASRDGRVQGVALDVSAASGLPLYQAQELGGALSRLRQRGKKIAAFADTFGESGGGLGAYLLASHADRIVLQPSGEVSILGLSLEQPYFAELLKDLGVTVRASQRHEFKGGIDPITGMAMPAAQKTALQAVLADLLDRAVAGIAHNRGLAGEEARRLIDGAPYDAVQAHGARLIDDIGYWDDAMNWLRTTSKTTKLVELAEYRKHVPDAPAEVRTLAVIQAVGPIVRGSAGNAPFADRAMLDASDVADALRQASRDISVAAIILRIDSPGGSYVASDTVFHAIEEARRAGKPVVASIGGIAASGGYYIALAADRIVALPTSLTGSIGVYSLKPVLTGLWDKIGVRWDGVRVGQHAGLHSPNRDFTDEEWAKFQQRLDRIYADFTDRVVANRPLTPEQVDAVARGRLWSGGQAHANGLVDRLGAFNDAVAEARHLARIPDATPTALAAFPREPDKLAKLMEIYRRLERIGGVLAPALPILEAFSPVFSKIRTTLGSFDLMDPAVAPAR